MEKNWDEDSENRLDVYDDHSISEQMSIDEEKTGIIEDEKKESEDTENGESENSSNG